MKRGPPGEEKKGDRFKPMQAPPQGPPEKKSESSITKKGKQSNGERNWGGFGVVWEGRGKSTGKGSQNREGVVKSLRKETSGRNPKRSHLGIIACTGEQEHIGERNIHGKNPQDRSISGCPEQGLLIRCDFQGGVNGGDLRWKWGVVNRAVKARPGKKNLYAAGK